MSQAMGVPGLLLLLLEALQAGDAASVAAARAKAADGSLAVEERAKAYEYLIQNQPAEVSLYSDYAALLIANRRYEGALEWLGNGLRVAPGNGGIRLRQGIALNRLNRFRESLEVLKGLPGSGEARLYMGLDSRALGDHKGAQRYLSEAWDLGVRDAYGLYSLIEEDHALGDKIAGLQHYRAFVGAFPESPWLHVLYANAYAQKNEEGEARKEYESALRLQPDLPAVNFRLGYLLYQAGEYGAAAECFRKELARTPGYSDANLFLGQTLRSLGREEEAIAYLKKAVAADGRQALAYKALVAALLEVKDLEGAAENLRRAEKEFPQDTSFPAQLASVLTKLNREGEALEELEKFRKLKEKLKP